jgi:HK97 family phage major capsid protein
MTTRNKTLLQRADIALSDLAANGGLLDAEQANAFIDMVMEQPTILRRVRTIRMTAPRRKINRIGFASRILRAARQTGGENDDGTNDRYLLASERSKPTTSQFEINTEEVIAEIRLPYELFEDNIEGDSLESHIMRLIAERAAIDLEELALAADTTSGDSFLALHDGYLKRMSVNVVDNLSAGITPALFKNGMLAMPQKYLRNLSQMSHVISVANTIKYRDVVAQRATGYGDAMLTSQQAINAYGVPVDAAPMLAAVGSGNQGFFTFLQNLVFGIQRDIRVEVDRDIRSREFIVVLTARVALGVEDPDAAVKYVNI